MELSQVILFHPKKPKKADSLLMKFSSTTNENV